MHFVNRIVSVAALAALFSPAASLSPTEWRNQSIYQVLTDRFARDDLSTTAPCNATEADYCGGTWKGLTNRLDYIQGMGFTAVWISPVVKQMEGRTMDGSAYHGYWAQDIWSLNPAFGTSEDLVALSKALHKRGMAILKYLMVDVVTNHMAYNGCGTCVDYKTFNPFNSESYFHPFCEIDFNNETSTQICWQGDNIVRRDIRDIFNNWASQLVANYSIDGLRIDSVKEVEPSFWPGFEKAAGVYCIGEVHDGDPSYVNSFQKSMDGVLDYPSFYSITQAFQTTKGSMGDLASGISIMKSEAMDTSLYGSFLENHDNPRFASVTKDMAIAFQMLKDGIPIVYQGQEQHYAGGSTPENREALWLSGYSTSFELYTWITSLNQIRSHAISQDAKYLSYNAVPTYNDSSTIALRKGFDGFQIVGIFTNVGSAGVASVTLSSSETGFTASEQLVDVMNCAPYTVDSSGSITAQLLGGLPLVLYPRTPLTGSGICSSLTGKAASVNASDSTSANMKFIGPKSTGSPTTTGTASSSKPTSEAWSLQ
ncbi:alpha-amylase [Thozetella sp. PMI_491]|nr:alpha-amylase [Thozetella sp. PMI_491]